MHLRQPGIFTPLHTFNGWQERPLTYRSRPCHVNIIIVRTTDYQLLLIYRQNRLDLTK